MRGWKAISLLGLFLFAAATITVTSSRSVKPALPESQRQHEQQDSFLILISFGHGDSPQERWTGTVAGLQGARISEARGWLFKSYDRLSLNSFEIRTLDPEKETVELKGIFLNGTSGPAGSIAVETSRGAFSISLSDLGAEKEQELLEGSVRVRGMRGVEKLSDSFRDDDFPSIAVLDESTAYAVWQSYSGQLDEIRFSKYDGGWRTFSRVPGVSGDVWRPQVAVDRKQRPWVVWSQQVAGNFDLYARALDEQGDVWLETVRLSSHPNPDIDHHLISDSRGNLWVVWQGFHGRNSDIFLRHYDGAE